MTKTQEVESIPPYAWFEEFFQGRVMPKTCKDMGDCEGFYSWLAANDPALYNQIEEADTEINSLWLSRSEQQSFKDACTKWYDLLMKAKRAFDAWKLKQREAVLNAGRQEGLPLAG